MRFRSKMAFQNFENVIYFDEVRNEFSQEIGKSSISHEFEKFRVWWVSIQKWREIFSEGEVLQVVEM